MKNKQLLSISIKIYFKRIVENIIYCFSWLFSFLIFVAIAFFCIDKRDRLLEISNDCSILSDYGTIFAVCSAIAIFISNLKVKRLEYTAELVNNFDNEDFRKARDLTRALNTNSSNDTLIKLISYKIKDRNDPEVKKLAALCDFNDEDCKKLERSIIFTFNYWQKAYNGIVFNMINEQYFRDHLSDVYISQYKRFHQWIEQISDNKMKSDLRNLYMWLEGEIWQIS